MVQSNRQNASRKFLECFRSFPDDLQQNFQQIIQNFTTDRIFHLKNFAQIFSTKFYFKIFFFQFRPELKKFSFKFWNFNFSNEKIHLKKKFSNQSKFLHYLFVISIKSRTTSDVNSRPSCAKSAENKEERKFNKISISIKSEPHQGKIFTHLSAIGFISELQSCFVFVDSFAIESNISIKIGKRIETQFRAENFQIKIKNIEFGDNGGWGCTEGEGERERMHWGEGGEERKRAWLQEQKS